MKSRYVSSLALTVQDGASLCPIQPISTQVTVCMSCKLPTPFHAPINNRPKRNPQIQQNKIRAYGMWAHGSSCSERVVYDQSKHTRVCLFSKCTAYSVNSTSADSESGSSSHPKLNDCLFSFPTSHVNHPTGGHAQIVK